MLPKFKKKEDNFKQDNNNNRFLIKQRSKGKHFEK